MKISEDKSSKLYSAISEPIMSARITIKSKNVLVKKNADDIDYLLFKLESKIWKEVKKALNISQP